MSERRLFTHFKHLEPLEGYTELEVVEYISRGLPKQNGPFCQCIFIWKASRTDDVNDRNRVIVITSKTDFPFLQYTN